MKEKIKVVIVFIIGTLISALISVYAATVISAGEVSYTDNKGIGASNVQDAINGVYSSANTLATNVSTLGTRVTALEHKTFGTAIAVTTSNQTTTNDGYVVITLKYAAANTVNVTLKINNTSVLVVCPNPSNSTAYSVYVKKGQSISYTSSVTFTATMGAVQFYPLTS